jgi:hypothetical protein
MGLLFNTPATNDILQQLNVFYGAATFDSLRVKSYYQGWPTGGRGGTYAFLAALGLTPKTGGPHSGQNWRTWLGLLDFHENAKKMPTEICARTVGNAIFDALDDRNFHQVEFFAVPDPAGLDHISVAVSDITAANGDKTKVITVYTLTFDKLATTAHP